MGNKPIRTTINNFIVFKQSFLISILQQIYRQGLTI